MSLFESRKKKLVDPVFGRLTYARKQWEGEISMKGASLPVTVWIDADPEGPNQDHREAFNKLATLLERGSAEIARALYTLYAPWLSVADFEVPRPDSPEELRAMLELDAIAISSSKPAQLLFGFAGEVWPDASFQIEIAGDGSVRPVSLDD